MNWPTSSEASALNQDQVAETDEQKELINKSANSEEEREHKEYKKYQRQQLKLQCLNQAIISRTSVNNDPNEIVKAAKAYYDFVKN